MHNHVQNWSKQYIQTKYNPVYPTEWVIRTIAGANYPFYKYNKNLYKGKKILDISCGDGRNLHLLLNLGFDVYATEISKETVDMLAKRYPEVKFSIGFNHKHQFADNFFDYALACGAFYYLQHETHFSDNLKELNRILKPEAIFFANMVTKETYVLSNATPLEHGEYLIVNDPHNFRNGYRWQVVNSKDELEQLITPYFSLLACSKLHDDYFGYLISNHIMVSQNKK
jgi:ubiquinone/menaquinone biosynthesis C-methylase UbiE